MKKCLSCGITLDDSVSYCTNCGASDFEPVVPDLSTDVVEDPVPAAPVLEVELSSGSEEASEATAEIPANSTAIPESTVQIATPITPPETPGPVPNIPGDARSFTIRDRIRKLASSKLSATFEIITVIQFVLVLVPLAVLCIMSRDSLEFTSVLVAAVILALPYLLQFLEASITYSSAKKDKKKMSSAGVVFGAIANIMQTVYAGLFLLAVILILVMGNTAVSLIKGFADSNLALSMDYIGTLDALFVTAGLNIGMNIVRFIPLVISALWFWAYILIDVAHTRTVGAIRCESIRKTPVVLPFLAMLFASLSILAVVFVPIFAKSVVSIPIPVETTAGAIAAFILGIAVCVLWAVGFFVKSILIIRLRACFKK